MKQIRARIRTERHLDVLIQLVKNNRRSPAILSRYQSVRGRLFEQRMTEKYPHLVRK